ncbi:MAG: PfaD family polyunsaturated fatty acid/polyketide biosynthesis protein [Phycisphaerae bacterium]
MPTSRRTPFGSWVPGEAGPQRGWDAIGLALSRVDRPMWVVEEDGEPALAVGGDIRIGDESSPATPGARAILAFVPPLHPSSLGDAAFRERHGLRYAYVAGAMANGIGSEAIVEESARAGMIGFFGAAGLSVARVEEAINRIQQSVGDQPYGFNLIHSPSERQLEDAVVDLYLRRGVRLVSASAYLDMTPPLIRYRVCGLRRDSRGRIEAANRVIAKVSRVEVARKFMSPPPEAMLRQLVEQGAVSPAQAALAQNIPVADDLTAEADSGGHTDNRPLVAMLPTMIALRDELQERYRYERPPCIGAAGGMATPASAAAAFAMGAAYVLTGTINQACVEAGTSDAVKQMLAKAGQADVAMAAAADMFEMGVKVQVLKWGTMFAARSQRLYEMYRAHESLDALSAKQRTTLERDYFRCPLDEAWRQTRAFFEQRDPRQIERAERDPQHKMALVFRSYLGQSSNWAVRGESSRKGDFQVWCGPAMGAFNEWARGSCLEDQSQRRVATLGLNLMLGAAVTLRAGWLRAQGVPLPSGTPRVRPIAQSELDTALG